MLRDDITSNNMNYITWIIIILIVIAVIVAAGKVYSWWSECLGYWPFLFEAHGVVQ